jgi:OOP family OmpA-OmpF porin
MRFVRSLSGLLVLAGLAACGSNPPAVTPEPAGLAVPVKVQKAVPEVAENRPTEAQAMATVDEKNNVFFMLGATTPDAAGRQQVLQHAARLKADPKLTVTLTGYTDDQGSPSYNLAIAEQRVNGIFQVLRQNGVRLNQIRRQVAGREELAQACRSTECRKKMRRVEFAYSE